MVVRAWLWSPHKARLGKEHLFQGDQKLEPEIEV